MRVPVRVFGSEKLVREMDDQVLAQAANVATLPGIVEASLCMPDAHWGYGFPIGGVAAIDPRGGVISAANVSFANHQVIQHRALEVLTEVFGRSREALAIRNVYDVSHNTAKLERHRIGGRERELLAHLVPVANVKG